MWYTVVSVLVGNLSAILIFFVVLLVLHHVLSSDEKLVLPPGPPRLPVLGSLPFLGRDMREPMRAMARKYGDMHTIYLGARRVIILNTHAAVKEAFHTNGHIVADRPDDLFYMTELCQGLGVISTSGDLWRTHRRFSHTALKDMGMGRGMLEPKIYEEVSSYLDYLLRRSDQPVNPHYITQMAVANIIYSIVNGKRSDYEDPEFVKFCNVLTETFEVLGNNGVVNVWPFLINLPGDPFSMQKMLGVRDYNNARFLKHIAEHRETLDPENPRDYIDIFLIHQEQEKNNPDSTFTDLQLMQLIGDFFGAGTETSSTTLLWGYVHMIRNPDIQRKVQKEIDDVIGRGNIPSMKHRAQMAYTEAVILEVQRMGDIVPFGVPHACSEDFTMAGYTFPKGTNFFPNIYNIHRNEDVWMNPYSFYPEHFLTDDGKLRKPEHMMAFSIGKRVCLGESLARMELFLFFTSLLQKFELSVPQGDKLPSVIGKLGATNIPYPFRVKLTERQ